MNKIVFFAGLFLNLLGASLSFYPLFQDFNESEYEIPFHKSDNFPNERDLLIMNVYADCQYSDSVFSQFEMNGEKMCQTAQIWVISLLSSISIGITMMIVASLITSKKFQYNQ